MLHNLSTDLVHIFEQTVKDLRWKARLIIGRTILQSFLLHLMPKKKAPSLKPL